MAGNRLALAVYVPRHWIMISDNLLFGWKLLVLSSICWLWDPVLPLFCSLSLNLLLFFPEKASDVGQPQALALTEGLANTSLQDWVGRVRLFKINQIESSLTTEMAWVSLSQCPYWVTIRTQTTFALFASNSQSILSMVPQQFLQGALLAHSKQHLLCLLHFETSLLESTADLN